MFFILASSDYIWNNIVAFLRELWYSKNGNYIRRYFMFRKLIETAKAIFEAILCPSKFRELTGQDEQERKN